MRPQNWVLVKREILREQQTEDEIVPVVDHVRTSSGDLLDYVHVVSPYEVVFVVAIDDRRRVGMIRQYRYLAEEELWEVPAGSPEGNESLEEGALRETEEELQVSVGSLSHIGTFYASIGITDQKNHVYIGTNLTLLSASTTEASISEIRWTEWSTAIDMVRSGAVTNGGAALALLLANDWILKSPKESGSAG